MEGGTDGRTDGRTDGEESGMDLDTLLTHYVLLARSAIAIVATEATANKETDF